MDKKDLSQMDNRSLLFETLKVTEENKKLSYATTKAMEYEIELREEMLKRMESSEVKNYVNEIRLSGKINFVERDNHTTKLLLIQEDKIVIEVIFKYIIDIYTIIYLEELDEIVIEGELHYPSSKEKPIIIGKTIGE